MKVKARQVRRDDVLSFDGRRHRVQVTFYDGSVAVVHAVCGDGYIDIDTEQRDIKRIKGVFQDGRLLELLVGNDDYDFIPDIVEKPTRPRKPAEPLHVEAPEAITPEEEEEMKWKMVAYVTSIVKGVQYVRNLKMLNRVEKELDERLAGLCVRFENSERPLLVKSLAFVRGCRESEINGCAYIDDFNAALNIVHAAPILLTGTNPLLVPAREKVPHYVIPSGLPPNIIARKDLYRVIKEEREVTTSAMDDLHSYQLIDVWRILVLKISIEFLRLLKNLFDVLSYIPGLKAIPRAINTWIQKLQQQLMQYVDVQGGVYSGDEIAEPLQSVLYDEGYSDEEVHEASHVFNSFINQLAAKVPTGMMFSNAFTYANTIIKFFAAEFPKQYPDKVHLLVAKYNIAEGKDKVIAAIGVDWMHLPTTEQKQIMEEIERDERLNFYWGDFLRRLDSKDGAKWILGDTYDQIIRD